MLKIISSTPSAKTYQLYILPGRCPPNFPHVNFHNRVYEFWKNFWADVFSGNQAASKPDANIFYRQDLVAVICHGEDIVGTLFFTENELSSNVTLDISYFNRPHISELCAKWAKKGQTGIATYEMLSVNAAYRKRLTGFSFGSVLLGLIAQAFSESRAQVMIGPVRLDNGVNAMVEDFGWELVSDPYQMHGTPVAISALYKTAIKSHPDQPLRALVQQLWRERIDLRTALAVDYKLVA